MKPRNCSYCTTRPPLLAPVTHINRHLTLQHQLHPLRIGMPYCSVGVTFTDVTHSANDFLQAIHSQCVKGYMQGPALATCVAPLPVSNKEQQQQQLRERSRVQQLLLL